MSNNRDLFRILISTDNHLGVWEKDEIRKDDSFNSFEEVFQIAKQQNVDLVLLGGDLFHDNKPSRQTIVRAMEVLTQYCLSDRPVAFQVLSDQALNFASKQVNFENPNYNIALPVFTIHGNHDDPAGAENLSAVDIMSSCNLVNYFGKIRIEGAGVGKVRIAPVLLRKGDTKVALYGLGNLRDERLGRLFQTPGCVEWVRPADTEEIPRDDWFSIFVLHQNRIAHGVAAKNYVRESYLARFLDLVVWGHEHECLADPWESLEAGGRFSVMQPGSSVATALSEGEAKRKHVVLLEVMGQQWRTIKMPLETVRPFVFESVALAEVKPLLDPENPEGVTAYLAGRVQEMIDKAQRDRNPRTPELPLVRLRVDYTGFSTINTQRFGQQFVGKVANPHDMILWQKAPKRAEKKEPEYADAPADLIRPEALDEARIEDLIAQHLTHNLEILPENDLAVALHEFVEKDNKSALTDAVTNVLKETQTAAVRDERASMDDDVAGVINEVAKQRQASQANASVLRAASQLGAEGSAGGAAAAAAAAAPRPGGRAAAASSRQAQSTQLRGASTTGGGGGFDDDDEDLAGPGPSSRQPAGARGASATPAAKGRGAKPPKVPAGGRGRQTTLTGLGKSPLNFEATGSQRGGRAQSEGLSSDVSPPSRRGSTRKAAGKAQQKMAASYKNALVDDEVEEDDEEVVLAEDSGGDAINDSDEEMEELEEEDEEEIAAPSRKRGRAAAAAAPKAGAAARGGRKAAAAPPPKFSEAADVVSLVDDSDDEAPAPVRPRGRAPAANRSQSQQLFGTGSQFSKGWGSVKH